ncbi:MAG: Uma2 family endonuclease [Saprospiraceae bacterium]
MYLDQNKKYTFEEFLVMEPELPYKAEFYNGQIIAMAGGTSNHSIIGSNAIRHLGNALDDSDCVVYNSDMKIAIEEFDSYVYPDVMIVCGGRDFVDDNQTIIRNPLLIIEVLSKSTKSYDKYEKFSKYRTLSSFKEYVLIHADQYKVEAFYKEDKTLWNISTIYDKNGEIVLNSINVTLKMQDIYKKTLGLD